ncbi:hypothetical protein FRC07_000500 [Ceratobasidium sp. 392]|nr:hypothetical protein FRC07_000500 [Ceratobasidium sp. 392]
MSALKKTLVQSPNLTPALVSVTDEAWWNLYVTTEFPTNRVDSSGRGRCWDNKSGGAWAPDLNGKCSFATGTGSCRKAADPTQGSSAASEVGLNNTCHTSSSKPVSPTLTLLKYPVDFQEQYKTGEAKFEEAIIGEILITGSDRARAIRQTLTILSVVALDGSSMSQEAITRGLESEPGYSYYNLNQAFGSLPACFMHPSCRDRTLVVLTPYAKRGAEDEDSFQRSCSKVATASDPFVLDIIASFSVGNFRERIDFGQDPRSIAILEQTLSPSNISTFLAAVWDRQGSLRALESQLRGLGEAIWSVVDSLSAQCDWWGNGQRTPTYYSPSISLMTMSLVGSQGGSELPEVSDLQHDPLPDSQGCPDQG